MGENMETRGRNQQYMIFYHLSQPRKAELPGTNAGRRYQVISGTVKVHTSYIGHIHYFELKKDRMT